jgi:FixJ family two-component response regulator
MKAGAVDLLTKPVSDQALLDAVIAGIALMAPAHGGDHRQAQS